MEENKKEISIIAVIILIIAIFVTAINIVLLVQNFSNTGKSYLGYVCNNIMNILAICIQGVNIVLIMLGFIKYISNKNKQFKKIFISVIVILMITFFIPVKHSTTYIYENNRNNNLNKNYSTNVGNELLLPDLEETRIITTSKNLYSITILETEDTTSGIMIVD